MINIRLEGHNFAYQVEDILRMFFHNAEIRHVEEEPPQVSGGIFVYSRLSQEGQHYSSHICYKDGDVEIKNSVPVEVDPEISSKAALRTEIKRTIQRHLFGILKQQTGAETPWGILTGIRPSKIVQEMIQAGETREEIFPKMQRTYGISREKLQLLYDVARTEADILGRTSPDRVSVYIGIPFCTSRCLYCSFTSNLIGKYKHLVLGYLDALKKEMQGVQQILRDKAMKIQSLYIGGGTPTSLDAETLGILLETIEQEFELDCLEEYTIEAGRPDSFDREKLALIKGSRADRISINPQTMNNRTLELIGRKHSAEDIVEAFHTARDLGFVNINMDVIAGLPGEDVSLFENTLRKLGELRPDSLTVHTMSVKRASRLHEEKENYTLTSGSEVAQMVDLGQQYADQMGLHPYYLYRQKNILGNLENIGYSRSGCESIYNIQIMEEKQSILALGAGGVTKVVYPEENRIERAFNVKSVEEYLVRVEEMLERKRALFGY